MFDFIKYHWFGLLISILFGLFLIEFFLVLFSPHVDNQNRGFVPCTSAMSEQIETCNKRKLCILNAVYNNYICDNKVIGEGLLLWIKGKQPRPWSNYIFSPEIPTYEDYEGLKEYYLSNPDIVNEMAELKEKHKELENTKYAK